jgi:benzylsuccinate CoA-transferase BbsE subunit
MLGYPVATVADIAADPQLKARGFFETLAGPGGTLETHCGGFAVIDGRRPPLRHAGGSSAATPGSPPTPPTSCRRPASP